MRVKKIQKRQCKICKYWYIASSASPCNKCKKTDDNKGSEFILDTTKEKGMTIKEIKKGMCLRETISNEICHVVKFVYNPYSINKEKIVLVKNCDNKEYMTHPSNLEKIK